MLGVSMRSTRGGVTWINPAAFAAPLTGTYGTLPRNFPVRSGIRLHRLLGIKNTKITERVNAQFRMEFFNLFNRKNLAPPSSGCGTVGSTTSLSESNLQCVLADWACPGHHQSTTGTAHPGSVLAKRSTCSWG